MGWMQTYTGAKFYPMEARFDEIRIEDIAHALSNQCRFAGHVQEFYSVAEHSVHVANVIGEWSGGRPDPMLWGLLHDAGEAYLTDIPTPVKLQFPNYRAAEDRVMKQICEFFRLEYEGTEDKAVVTPSIVKEADRMMLSVEARDLMGDPKWPSLVPVTVDLKIEKTKTPPQAKEDFLNLFKRLMVERSQGRGL